MDRSKVDACVSALVGGTACAVAWAAGAVSGNGGSMGRTTEVLAAVGYVGPWKARRGRLRGGVLTRGEEGRPAEASLDAKEARTSLIRASLSGPGAIKASGGVSGTPAVCTACGSSTPKGVAGAGTTRASVPPPASRATAAETYAPRVDCTSSGESLAGGASSGPAKERERPASAAAGPRTRQAGLSAGGEPVRGGGGALRLSGVSGPHGGRRAAAPRGSTRVDEGPRVAGGTVTAPSRTRWGKRRARVAGIATSLGTARSVRCPARLARERSPVRVPGAARGGRAGGPGRAAGRGARSLACCSHWYHGRPQAQCQ